MCEQPRVGMRQRYYRGKENMNRTTDELMKQLLSKEELPQYIRENSSEFLQASLAEYLNRLLEEHGLKKSSAIADAQIERSYGYQLFSGRREMPSRDVLISLALAMKLSLDETQSLLRIAHMAMLYPRVKRDSIIIHALIKQESVVKCNEMLESLDEATLGE